MLTSGVVVKCCERLSSFEVGKFVKSGKVLTGGVFDSQLLLND
jgi:hypothetical protein